MWVWCMSGGVCLCLGFLGIPWGSITQMFPILVPRLFWYQIILYDTVFEAFSRLQICLIPPKNENSRYRYVTLWPELSWMIHLLGTFWRTELLVQKEWNHSLDFQSFQQMWIWNWKKIWWEITAMQWRHRTALESISKIKLYLHDGPVYRWYNWYKNYLPGDDGTLRRV